MKILFIAPIPPPINGQSKASKVLLDALSINKHEISVINLRKNSLKNGFSSFGRFFVILDVLVKIWKKRNNNDLIYLSLAESFLGNARDLLIYTICYRSKHKIIVHMLGGAGMKQILSRRGIQNFLNCFFIKKIGGVIVEGPENFKLFSKIIAQEKVHIVPNFAEDFLFVTDDQIAEKFFDINKINILYLSNLIPGKGYDELTDAFIGLSEDFKNQINIKYVGGFESSKAESQFLKKIESYYGLSYLGKFIDGEMKKDLYLKSHIFCLPTYYPFEGQPISILEAYATGCVVITSNHSGIPFIFTHEKNGFMVDKKSILSIQMAIERVLKDKAILKTIGLNNKNNAFEKYRASIYQDAILHIFNKISPA
jgi:glycosyltransferase involved in cell wall biosynthesis